MQTCPFSTLRRHSEGVTYAPKLVDGLWQLQSTLNDVLVGYRGKTYEFHTQKNAQTWLCTNLARNLNAEEPTSIDFILQLGEIFTKTGFEPVQQEIIDISELNQGLWIPVECAGSVQIIDNTTVDWDGGFAAD